MLVRVVDQHGELVAAEPCRKVAGADDALDPCADLREELVSDVVAPAVVHRLEPVEVDVEDSDPVPGSRSLRRSARLSTKWKRFGSPVSVSW